MNGIHIIGSNRRLPETEVAVAWTDLPPGKYIVFANLQMCVLSNSNVLSMSDKVGVAFIARLVLGNISNELTGNLKYDYSGSKYESIALSVAGEFDGDTSVELRIYAGKDNIIFVEQPRISILKLDELKIIKSQGERNKVKG